MLTFNQEIQTTKNKTVSLKPGTYYFKYEDFNEDQQFVKLTIRDDIDSIEKITVTESDEVSGINVYKSDDIPFWCKKFFEKDPRVKKIREAEFVGAYNFIKNLI